MKVYFERTGGFAGLKTSVLLDTDKMSHDESEEFYSVYNNTNFLHLPQKTESKNNVADVFHYKITVEMQDEKYTVETTDLSLTPEFENFINFLSDKALHK